jgi:hypothetical protein
MLQWWKAKNKMATLANKSEQNRAFGEQGWGGDKSRKSGES